jgi:hypothetical protein
MGDFTYTVDGKSVSFPDLETYDTWRLEAGGLRDVIADINYAVRPGKARVPKYREWLELVHGFVQTWGERLVPRDIKRAVNSVEGGIGVPLTVWEEQDW